MVLYRVRSAWDPPGLTTKFNEHLVNLVLTDEGPALQRPEIKALYRPRSKPFTARRHRFKEVKCGRSGVVARVRRKASILFVLSAQHRVKDVRSSNFCSSCMGGRDFGGRMENVSCLTVPQIGMLFPKISDEALKLMRPNSSTATNDRKGRISNSDDGTLRSTRRLSWRSIGTGLRARSPIEMDAWFIANPPSTRLRHVESSCKNWENMMSCVMSRWVSCSQGVVYIGSETRQILSLRRFGMCEGMCKRVYMLRTSVSKAWKLMDWVSSVKHIRPSQESGKSMERVWILLENVWINELARGEFDALSTETLILNGRGWDLSIQRSHILIRLAEFFGHFSVSICKCFQI